jgi:hypothetical protein
VGIAGFSAKLLSGIGAMLNRRSYSSCCNIWQISPSVAIYETALCAYLTPAARDQRDAMLSRRLKRFGRAIKSVDWNAKMLIAMLTYHIEMDPSFLLEPPTTDGAIWSRLPPGRPGRRTLPLHTGGSTSD